MEQTEQQRRLSIRATELRADYEDVTTVSTMVEREVVQKLSVRNLKSLTVHAWIGADRVGYTPASDEVCFACGRAFSHGIHEKLVQLGDEEEFDFTSHPKRADWSDRQVADFFSFLRRHDLDENANVTVDTDVDEDWNREETVTVAGVDAYSPTHRQPAKRRSAPLARQWWDAEQLPYRE